MTTNQINFAKIKEDVRHNKEQERLSKAQNKINKEHYERSDSATKEHYERSDAAGLISANASALNAQTNRKNYQMAYDIEYGWTGDVGYPKGMPLSAQQKNLTIQTGIQQYDLTRDLTRAQIEQAQADAAAKKISAITNIANAIFGKQGALNGVNSIVNSDLS